MNPIDQAFIEVFGERPEEPTIEMSPAVIREVRKFVEQLEPYAALQDEWSGPNSFGPNTGAIVMAIRTCLAIVQSGLPRPKPKMLSEGTLGCYWQAGESYAAMDFEEDGEHVWTVTDGQNFRSGTWKVGEVLPKAIDSITVLEE